MLVWSHTGLWLVAMLAVSLDPFVDDESNMVLEVMESLPMSSRFGALSINLLASRCHWIW